jgi:hypothetical protein
MNNDKKLGMYIGVALLVGAFGFIAYNKLTSTKLQVGNTTIATDEPIKPEVATTNTKPFSSNNPVFSSQLSIKAPAIATDLLNSFK